MSIDYESSINPMLAALGIAVTAGIVTRVASSMMDSVNARQRSNVSRVCGKKSSKARQYKAEQFRTKGTGLEMRNFWGGDFSNIGF